MKKQQLLINGKWLDAEDGGTIPVINPNNGLQNGTLARGNSLDIDKAVVAARTAFHGLWRKMAALEKGRLIYRLGELILKNEDELSYLEANDVGKPLSHGTKETKQNK